MGLIRFILACIVVLCHTSTIFGYNPLPSDLAVQSFFVISGFYMSLVLNEKYPKGSNSLFFKNRALKIYPTYWLILILLVGWGLLVNCLGYPGTIWFYQYAAPLSTPTWLYFIITNLFIFGLDYSFILGIQNGHLYFTKSYGSSNPNVYSFAFNSIGWTVGVELLFYLIAPFILRGRTFFIVLLLVGSLALRVLLATNGMSGHPWDYMFFPTQLMYFMAGAISYRIYISIKSNPIWNKLLKVQYVLLVILMVFYSYIFSNSYSHQAILFLLLALIIPAAFEVSKSNKVDKYLGQLSYPIYISQMLVITATRAKAFPKLINIGFTTLIITIVLSIAIYHFVTKPIERIRQSPFK
ncbi:MAG: acyltransferase [Bacteroidota bacterium]